MLLIIATTLYSIPCQHFLNLLFYVVQIVKSVNNEEGKDEK